MALISSVLANELISEIKSRYSGPQESWPTAPFFYMDVIKRVLERDAVITYSYTGVTAAGVPEAAVLQGKLSLPLCTETSAPNTKALVTTLIEANPTAFVSAIVNDCIGVVQIETVGYAGTPVPTIYQVTGATIDISKSKDMESCWNTIASAIIERIKTLTTLPIVTTSPTGAGTSIFSSIL